VCGEWAPRRRESGDQPRTHLVTRPSRCSTVSNVRSAAKGRAANRAPRSRGTVAPPRGISACRARTRPTRS
jgi:hypothetical protein